MMNQPTTPMTYRQMPRPAVPSVNLTPAQGGMPWPAQPALYNPYTQQSANPESPQSILSEMLPTPMNFAKGAGVGLVSAIILSYLMRQSDKPGIGSAPIINGAKALDEFAPVRWLNEKLESGINSASQNRPWLKQLMIVEPVKDITASVNQMETEQLNRLFSTFAPRIQDARHYQTFLSKNKAAILKTFNEKVDAFIAEESKALAPSNTQAVKQLINRKNQLKQWAKQMPDFTKMNEAQLKTPGFDGLKLWVESKTEVLAQEGASKENRRLAHVLTGLKERVGGLKNYYKPIYVSQLELAKTLQSKNMGPIGRGIAQAGNYLLRVLNGETTKMNGAKGLMGLFNSSLFAPLAAGAVIFGLSFNKADKAEKGEKVKAFFQDFIGAGIGNFLGWEYGRRFLNTTGIVQKVLGKRSTKILPKLFGQWRIPLLGGLTLGGFTTEILAIWGFGSLFEKVGQKVSHAIFGKPKEQENPLQQGFLQNPAQWQSFPQQAYGPQFAAAGNIPNVNNPNPFSFPGMNGRSMAGNPLQGTLPRQTMPAGTPPMSAPYANTPAPAISLRPDEIARSTVAESQKQEELQLLSSVAQKNKAH